MLDVDMCRCEHGWTLHRVGSNGACDVCGCPGFIACTEARWVPLVRAAELMIRDPESRLIVRREAHHWTFRIETGSREELNRGAHPDEPYQLAELTGTRWLDVANEQRTRNPELHMPLEAAPCWTCDAPINVPCNPMHAGERDPGGWSHPTRGLKAADDESEVVRWARRVKSGEQGEIWPGTMKVIRKAVFEVVDEILALRYVNECLRSAVASPNVRAANSALRDGQILSLTRSGSLAPGDPVEWVNMSMDMVRRSRQGQNIIGYVIDAPPGFPATPDGSSWITINGDAYQRNVGVGRRVVDARQSCGMCSGTGVNTDTGNRCICDVGVYGGGAVMR